jgi:hypothetical protein
MSCGVCVQLYICEFCLKFYKHKSELLWHTKKCKTRVRSMHVRDGGDVTYTAFGDCDSRHRASPLCAHTHTHTHTLLCRRSSLWAICNERKQGRQSFERMRFHSNAMLVGEPMAWCVCLCGLREARICVCLQHPPGDEVYRKDGLSVFEVDGSIEKFYCQVSDCSLRLR